MNKLEKYLLKWISKRIIKQSEYHRTNLIEYYQVIQDAAKDEFTEDNIPTIEYFLKNCHHEALVQLWKNVPNTYVCAHCNTVNTINQYCRNCRKTKGDESSKLTHKEYLNPPICALCRKPLVYNQLKHTMVCISCNGSRNADSEEIVNNYDYR